MAEGLVPFEECARLPFPEDNAAVASLELAAGQRIGWAGGEITLAQRVLEGHRFAVRPVARGEALLSWGLPFGHALRALAAGEWLCNARMIATLQGRTLEIDLPEAPNFADHIQVYALPAAFRGGEQVPLREEAGTFMGFVRGGQRGVGVRNHVVLLAVSSQANAYVRLLGERLAQATQGLPHVDSVVAVQHTEGGDQEAPPNNRELLLRTLGGFIVHPNVGAVLVVDHPQGAVNNTMLRQWMAAQGLPLEQVMHSFMSLGGDFAAALAQGAEMVSLWLPRVNGFQRSRAPLSALKLALQCGGSDSFSGLSGNPLAGWVAKELIRHGGAAVLAETDELIGAEPYILSNVRDRQTAEAFLAKIAAFKQRAAWHGHSAEGNPSGGNLLRGLYNIALKSLGAARKKDPAVRLDYVLEYAERMEAPGYYFMDSPGNDLESIAGQVASGSQIIVFITGNGSITNFPFAPTLKFVTTSGRWRMLAHEMDVNAGRHQDGESLEALGAEVFAQLQGLAAGQRSLGERAGHYQVSIWRNWQHSQQAAVEEILGRARPTGAPLEFIPPAQPLQGTFQGLAAPGGVCVEQVGLVAPTSLCSGQIARLAAEQLNQHNPAPHSVSRFVSLVHTEGCGAAPGYSEELYLRTMTGHLRHPMVRKALLLEHGCEKTHNDAMRLHLQQQGVDPQRFGFASVQLDGGLERVLEKAAAWFSGELQAAESPSRQPAGLGALRLGLTSAGRLEEAPAQALALLAASIVAQGGLVVLPQNATLLRNAAFCSALFPSGRSPAPSLGYGEYAETPGLHIMEAPTRHSVETLTGLGATGVQLMAAHLSLAPLQTHPMIPLVQLSADAATQQRYAADLDCTPSPAAAPRELAQHFLEALLQTASREQVPRLFAQGNSDFQLTRGLLGFSL